jgi:hypothetical protein
MKSGKFDVTLVLVLRAKTLLADGPQRLVAANDENDAGDRAVSPPPPSPVRSVGAPAPPFMVPRTRVELQAKRM